MAKRIMVYNNLVKNSISAYFVAVELHNKPNMAFSTLLRMVLIRLGDKADERSAALDMKS